MRNRSIVMTLAIMAGAGMASNASANPIGSGNSMFYYPPWASATCKAKFTVANMFEGATLNWREGLRNQNVSVGPHDASVYWEELTEFRHGGRDHRDNNVDTADLSFLATHGLPTLSPASCYTVENLACRYTRWSAHLTSESGVPDGSCEANTVNMDMGNDQTEYLDVFACNSVEKRGIDFLQTASTGLHQWHGFSGTMAPGTGTTDKLDDYLDDAFDGSASQAWVSNLTSLGHYADGTDVCAASLVIGNSVADATTRWVTERYGSGNFPDPTGNSQVFNYFADCDPPAPQPGRMGDWPYVLDVPLPPIPPPPFGQAPEGFLDEASMFVIRGWARDPDNNTPIDVEIRIDGQQRAVIAADDFRADVGSRAYSWTPPRLGIGAHRVEVRAWGEDFVGRWDGFNAQLALSPATYYEYDFVKPGNNGTATCTQFCEGAVWGEVGGCVSGFRSDTNERLGCFSAPGFLGGHQLTCECERGFEKPGNNGTVSCDTFCDGEVWGRVGRCVGAVRSDNGERLACDEVPGFLGGHQLTCQCVPKVILL